jgi:hypothetical protein
MTTLHGAGLVLFSFGLSMRQRVADLLLGNVAHRRQRQPLIDKTGVLRRYGLNKVGLISGPSIEMAVSVTYFNLGTVSCSLPYPSTTSDYFRTDGVASQRRSSNKMSIFMVRPLAACLVLQPAACLFVRAPWFTKNMA